MVANQNDGLPPEDDLLPEVGGGNYLTLSLQHPHSFRLLFYSAVYMDSCDKEGKRYSEDEARRYVTYHAPGPTLGPASQMGENSIFRRDTQSRALFLLEDEPYSEVKDYVAKQMGRQPRDFYNDIDGFFQPVSDPDQPHAFTSSVAQIWQMLQAKGGLKIDMLWSNSSYVLSNVGGQRSVLVEVTADHHDRGTYNVVCNAFTEAQIDHARDVTDEYPIVRLACAPRFAQRALELAIEPKISVVLWDAVSIWEMLHQLPTATNKCRRLTRLLPEFLNQVGLFAFSPAAWNRVRVQPRDNGSAKKPRD